MHTHPVTHHEQVQFPELDRESMPVSSGSVLNQLEQCLMCRWYIKMGKSQAQTAAVWGIIRQQCGRYLRTWLSRWEKSAKRYCQLVVDAEYLREHSQPLGFEGRYGKPVSHATDGSVVRTDQPRNLSVYTKLMANHKTNGSGWCGELMS